MDSGIHSTDIRIPWLHTVSRRLERSSCLLQNERWICQWGNNIITGSTAINWKKYDAYLDNLHKDYPSNETDRPIYAYVGWSIWCFQAVFEQKTWHSQKHCHDNFLERE